MAHTFLYALLSSAVLASGGCDDGAEEVGEGIDESIEEAGDAVDDVTDEVD